MPEHACVHAGDRWLDGPRMERLMDLNVCMSVRVCAHVQPCLCACAPVCEDGTINVKPDG